MSNFAIQVEGLGKRYRIGASSKRHDNLRSALTALVSAPFRNLSRLRGLSRFDGDERDSTVWALEDVSFDVPNGEVLGIIGRNGAGKSTLLKVLSRITEPTRGRVVLNGRVGALLEVGTGFHPELTGRENVFLNGSILGMDRRYIEKRFDEIVEFSGVERFIDTPVKRYSSGMYLRLAFSVAAHLEPEVLVVDEVLAVGDAEFQKKCLGKMGEVAGSGRTVIFVSHQLGSVRGLCTSAILMRDGRVAASGTPDVVIEQYLASEPLEAERRWDRTSPRRPGNRDVAFQAIRTMSTDGQTRSSFSTDEPIRVEVDYEVLHPVRDLRVGFEVMQGDGVVAFQSGSGDVADYSGAPSGAFEPGSYRSSLVIPAMWLNSGRYYFRLLSYIPNVEMVVTGDVGIPLQVEAGIPLGGHGRRPGAIRPLMPWATTELPRITG